MVSPSGVLSGVAVLRSTTRLEVPEDAGSVVGWPGGGVVVPGPVEAVLVGAAGVVTLAIALSEL
jgi:hypothetical protein